MQKISQTREPARRRKLSLESKLAAYALATGTILAAPPQTSADIIYSGVVDKPLERNASLELDLNGDGTTDFTVLNLIVGREAVLAVEAPSNNTVVITPPDAAALNPFDEVSANDQLGGGLRGMVAFAVSSSGYYFSGYNSSGPWANAQNKFLGLRFVFPDGSNHYGWARLSVGGFNAVATLHDWAYEDIPEKPILAGDTIGGGGGGGAAFPPAAPPPRAPEPSPLAVLAHGAAGVEIHLRSQPCPSGLPGNSFWSAGMPPIGR
jgi:hypothetical protein